MDENIPLNMQDEVNENTPLEDVQSAGIKENNPNGIELDSLDVDQSKYSKWTKLVSKQSKVSFNSGKTNEDASEEEEESANG